MRNQGSVEIERPIEEVFILTNNHVAEWSSIVVEDEVIEEMPEQVGTTFRTVTEEKGRRMEFQGVVTRWEPPHTSAIRLTGDMFDLEVKYTFERRTGGTLVTQRSRVTGKGFFKGFLRLFGWLMKKSSCSALEDELKRLKAFCEQQESSPVQ